MLAVLKRGALLLLLSAATSRADWKVDSSQRETARAGLVEHLQIAITDSATGERADLHLAVFSTKSCTLRMIDQPKEPRTDLAQAMQREQCLAGVNGGYFDPQDAPVGLLVSDGRLIAPLRKARLLSGVMIVSNGRVQLLRYAEYSAKRKATEALQCGPFLVDRGVTVPGLDDTRSARRTFIATYGSDRTALGFCSGVTLAQLAQILAAIEMLPGAKIQRALNLDGGSSSAFWFHGEREAFSIPEQKTVRDFVAVVPK